MKSDTRNFGILTVLMLLVVGTAMYMSLGFQIFRDEFSLPGVAGYIVLFTLVAVGLMISARKQGGSVLRKW